LCSKIFFTTSARKAPSEASEGSHSHESTSSDSPARVALRTEKTSRGDPRATFFARDSSRATLRAHPFAHAPAVAKTIREWETMKRRAPPADRD
jgi:hypothetical protein